MGQSHEMDKALVGMMHSSMPSQLPGLVFEFELECSDFIQKLENSLRLMPNTGGYFMYIH